MTAWVALRSTGTGWHTCAHACPRHEQDAVSGDRSGIVHSSITDRVELDELPCRGKEVSVW
jgi:hypothetical protein